MYVSTSHQIILSKLLPSEHTLWMFLIRHFYTIELIRKEAEVRETVSRFSRVKVSKEYGTEQSSCSELID